MLLRAGAPWRDLPKNYGPYTTCYEAARKLNRKWIGIDVTYLAIALDDAPTHNGLLRASPMQKQQAGN
jgi:transposase